MTEPSLVSILVPCYNNQQFIFEALRSIFAQTYPNIEVLIGDDCSRQFDADKVITWITNNRPANIRKVILIQNEENLGTVANMEKLQQQANGEYCFHIAADDAIYDALVIERMINAFNELGEEAQILTGQTEMWDDKLQHKMRDFVSEEDRNLMNKGTIQQILDEVSYRCFIPAVCCYRRSLLEKIGTLSEHYRLVEDWPSHIRLLVQGIRIWCLDITTIKHRDGGISHGNKQQSSDYFLQYYCDILNIFPYEVEPNLHLLSEAGTARAKQYGADRVRAYYKIHIPNYEKAVAQTKTEAVQSVSSPTQPAAKAVPVPVVSYQLSKKNRLRETFKRITFRLSRKEVVQKTFVLSLLLFIAAAATLQLNDTPAQVMRWFFEIGGYCGIVCTLGEVAFNLFFRARGIVHRRRSVR